MLNKSQQRSLTYNSLREDYSELARRTIPIKLMIFLQTLLMLRKKHKKKGRKDLMLNKNLSNKTKMTFLMRLLAQSNLALLDPTRM